jgi:hypothetical protein
MEEHRLVISLSDDLKGIACLLAGRFTVLHDYVNDGCRNAAPNIIAEPAENGRTLIFSFPCAKRASWRTLRWFEYPSHDPERFPFPKPMAKTLRADDKAPKRLNMAVQGVLELTIRTLRVVPDPDDRRHFGNGRPEIYLFPRIILGMLRARQRNMWWFGDRDAEITKDPAQAKCKGVNCEGFEIEGIFEADRRDKSRFVLCDLCDDRPKAKDLISA